MSNKHNLAIQFQFSLEDIRRALAITVGKTFTDEELMEQYINREPLQVDLSTVDQEQNLQMCMAFSVMIYGDNLDKK